MAKVDARSPDGHSVEIKLDERKSERRRQSQERAPERRRNEQRRQPSLDHELRSRGYATVVQHEDSQGRAGGPVAGPALSWRPRSDPRRRTARAWRRNSVRWATPCRRTARRGQSLDRRVADGDSSLFHHRFHDRSQDRATGSARPGTVRAARHIADRPGLASQPTDPDAAISTNAGSSHLRARFRCRPVDRRESQNAGS